MKSLSTTVVETTPPSAQGYRSYVLPSGMRAIIYIDDNPVSYAGYLIGAGSANDPLRYHGVAHFTEHMLFKGTKKRNARQIINRMEEIGADFNAFTTKEETFVYTAFPYAYFTRVIDLMTDVICNSSCPEEELLKEREVILEEIKSYLDSPSDRIFDEYESLLFHGTPLGHHILGTECSVRRIGCNVVTEFMKSNYIAQNMVFCYRGRPIDCHALFDFLQLHFPPSSVSCSTSFSPKRKSYYPSPIKREVNHRFNTYQVYRIIGYHAYSLSSKKRIGMALLNNIFGGRGMNSRLNLLLREEKGWVYSVESGFYPYRYAGYIAIFFATTKEKLHQATEAVKNEIKKLKEQPISRSDLRTAKRQFVGQLIVQEDNRETSFLEMGKSFYHFNNYNTTEQIGREIDKYTSEDLQKIAQEIFLADHFLALTYY